MLLVKTKLQASPIHGIGVFADEFIPAGTKTWEVHNQFDVLMNGADVANLPQYAREEMLFHGYLDKNFGVYVLCSDNAKFMNHSSTPNINSTGLFDLADRDIQPGEELTCNYENFDAEFEAKLYK